MTRRAVSRACGHDLEYRIDQAWWHDGERIASCEANRCARCGEWLPLGPSNDAPDEVQVEMRAAEIAANGCMNDFVHREFFGWLAHDEDARCDPPTYETQRASDEWHTGFLARCIDAHDHDRITEHGND
jgi:hypothetical protein